MAGWQVAFAGQAGAAGGKQGAGRRPPRRAPSGGRPAPQKGAAARAGAGGGDPPEALFVLSISFPWVKNGACAVCGARWSAPERAICSSISLRGAGRAAAAVASGFLGQGLGGSGPAPCPAGRVAPNTGRVCAGSGGLGASAPGGCAAPSRAAAGGNKIHTRY
ncbi:MAG: hypothetical protein J3K34DRAFT_399027 [Monoraphidium minutum]|nr:MAG: hypothetical protein J3K34DRAFT_399027 [Monoraphidium minutum]